MAAPERVSRQSLTERATELIRQDVLRGHLLPREPLVESELAEIYNMSKTPIRAALQALVQDGLVENHPFRGWRVRDLGTEDAREIYELREILEPLALMRAMPHIDAGYIAGLRGQLANATKAMDEGNLVELSRLNRSFHRALYRRSPNCRLVEILDRMQEQLQVMALRAWTMSATYNEEARQHNAILDAIEAGDSDLSAELLRFHIGEFRDRFTRTSA